MKLYNKYIIALMYKKIPTLKAESVWETTVFLDIGVGKSVGIDIFYKIRNSALK